MLDKEQFKKVCDLLQRGFGNRMPVDLSDPRVISVWHNSLKDLGLKNLLGAITHMIDTKKGGGPLVADIREAVRQFYTQDHDAVFNECMIFAQLLKAPVWSAQANGGEGGFLPPRTRPVRDEFGKVIEEAKEPSAACLYMLKVFGLDRFLNAEEKDMNTLRAQFRDSYNSIRNTAARDKSFAAIGLHSQERYSQRQAIAAQVDKLSANKSMLPENRR